MFEVETDRIVIIGAGSGALYAALMLAPRPVLIISPDALGEGARSAWAQGGVAGAMDVADSPQMHASDTIRAGAGTVDADVALAVTAEAKAHILRLIELGTPFDRAANGDYVMSREAAHSFVRVVRVRGDPAGAEIMQALIAQVRATPSVQTFEGVIAVRLDTRDSDVIGVEVELSRPEGAPAMIIRGAAYLLARNGRMLVMP